MNQELNNIFRPDEIVWMTHFDKSTGEWVKTPYPKISGRLRLAHEDNPELKISTKIIQFDEQIAVVKATVETSKGIFTGTGMSSAERDVKIVPAILELAETRAIARALRFSCYGLEFCSAEEISHLDENVESELENHPEPPSPATRNYVEKPIYCGADGTPTPTQPPQDKKNSRISNRQLNYIINLGKSIGWDSKDLNEESLKAFGVNLEYLSVKEASHFIDQLKAMTN